MPNSEARKKSSAAWDAENMRTLGTRCRKDKAEAIRVHAASRGQTVSAYIMGLIDEDMSKPKSGK